MLIILIWLGGLFPPKYHETLEACQQQPRNQCVILGEMDWQYYLPKYRHMLNISESRIRAMTIADRSDLLRLFYLYQNGGVYTDLDNTINYDCIYNFFQGETQSFFSQEQKLPEYPSNNFIYVPKRHDAQIQRVIREINSCQECWDIRFVGPWMIYKLHIKFVDTPHWKECVFHLYHSNWWWWTQEQKHLVTQITAKNYKQCFQELQQCQISNYCPEQSLEDCEKISKKDDEELSRCNTEKESSQFLLRYYKPVYQQCKNDLKMALLNPIDPPTKISLTFKAIMIIFGLFSIFLGYQVRMKIRKLKKSSKNIKIPSSLENQEEQI